MAQGGSELVRLNESPEVLLRTLNRDLLRLSAASSHLNDRDVTMKIVDVLRRTVATEVLHDLYVVAVTGSQGAGKTTLVQQILGLDNRLLPPNVGRGERMPVLITEDADVSEPTPFSRDLADADPDNPNAPITAASPLDHAEWLLTLQGARHRSLLAEVRVPVGQGLGGGRALLLLPGHETRTRENWMWQDYLQQALAASSMGIVVVDHSRLANVMADQIAREVAQLVDGSRPIVVITKTERLDDESKAELTTTAATTFAIPDTELDRIVLTGLDFDIDWRPHLASVIDAYGNISQSSRHLQLNQLRTLIADDLSQVIDDVDNARSDHQGGNTTEQRSAEAALDTFDRAAASLRHEFDKKVAEAIQSHANSAARLAKQDHQDDEEGMTRLPVRVIRFFKDSAGDKENRAEKRLRTAWDEADDRGAGFGPRFADTLGDIVSRRLSVAAPVPLKPGSISDRLPAQRLGEPGHDIVLPDGTEHDLRLLSVMDRETIIKPTKEWSAAISLMPLLALEFVRTAQITPEMLSLSPKSFTTADFDPTEFATKVSGAWQGWSVAQRTLLFTAATVFGLDAIDGEINTIPAFATGVNASLSAAGVPGWIAGATSTAVGAAVSVVGAGALAAIVVNEARRRDSNQRAAITQTVSAMGDQYLAHYRDGFDDLMTGTRDVLEARLTRWLNLDADFARDQWLGKVLSDVRTRRNDLLDAINANPLIAAPTA